MSTGTNIQPRYSPRFKVDIGDTKFQEPGGRIADLVVETTLDGADRFSFTLNFPFDEELGEFSGLTWDDFAVGTDVEIAMGYGGDGTLTPLLTGSIRSINAEFTTDRGPSVTVSGYGLLWELMQGTRSDSWAEETVGTAVEDVLSSYPFSTVDVSDASIKREKLIQDGQSDYRFLQQLAETYGFEFYAERDTVRFRPRSAKGDGDGPVAELWYGEALHDFYAEITRRSQIDEVEVRSWDEQNKSEIVATAGSTNANYKEVFRVQAMSRDEAKRVAETKLNRFSDGVITGHGEADGTPEIRAGSVIRLEELGGRFSADYYVTEATHRMGSAGYRTSFEVTEVSS
ncbi:phage late control D family protein [Natrinema altunense]|uniref:Phage protein D n=1 Tax=Natrinema altunense (strain JCM 12890 / CGMCC 1.3731 / AJ2) TaxID=1227494 RepID=L9ZJK0_NATA2|nr:contractile injection system protein, VgrG/Pvc8 family [Natrinema altunense]ELY85348.1 phage protein D [Natrinema altunense JCM 12890]